MIATGEHPESGFSILLLGRTGVGKSSTVNSLFGRFVTEVGDFEDTTLGILTCEGVVNGAKYTIFDTPGLDGYEDQHDVKTLQLIKDHIESTDIIVYVTRLDETRLRPDERNAIKLISEMFGRDCWCHSILVFTFANKVDVERYEEVTQKRAEQIRSVIKAYTCSDEAEQIPAICIDNATPQLANGRKWLGELYITIMDRMRERGLRAFAIATEPHLKALRIVQ